MSKERDIDDILDSLNQLLREGESHNDDHVELDALAEGIEAELHALEEHVVDAEKQTAGTPENIDEVVKQVALETGSNTKLETINPALSQNKDIESDESFETDSVYEIPDDDFGGNPADDADGSDEQIIDLIDAPVLTQRVVLTEEMLVNNPQGNLLSMANTDKKESQNTTAESKAVAVEAQGTVRDADVLDVNDLPMQQLLKQLLDKVSDDVIGQLQQQLPSLIKASFDRHLAASKDTKHDGNPSESGNTKE